jgi:hypothetical protein
LSPPDGHRWDAVNQRFEVDDVRIKHAILEAIGFLFDNRDSAAAMDENGGTAFLVDQPSETHPQLAFIYAVTAAHNVSGRDDESLFPVLKIREGGEWRAEPFDFGRDDWECDDHDDVAIARLGLRRDLNLSYAVPRGWFVTPDDVSRDLDATRIGPGDEAFYVGRFLPPSGRAMEQPAVRFGNVSMLPFEPIHHKTRGDVEAFVVEGRSLPGHSGAPTFRLASDGRALLGVDWGHINDKHEVFDESGKKTKMWVWEHSGFMGVTPAWKIAELLDAPAELEWRESVASGERQWRRGTALDAGEDKPAEFERFEDLTRKLVNTPKSELDDQREDQS